MVNRPQKIKHISLVLFLCGHHFNDLENFQENHLGEGLEFIISQSPKNIFIENTSIILY